MPKAEPPEQSMRKYNARLVQLLMTDVPKELKQNVLDENSDDILSMA